LAAALLRSPSPLLGMLTGSEELVPRDEKGLTYDEFLLDGWSAAWLATKRH
jgi:hypothetical protein